MKKIAAFIASGSGMGADAAKHLRNKGYDVAIMSSSGKGEKLAKDLDGFGFTGSNLVTEDIKNFINKVHSKFGKIDVLVNSAGHGPKGNLVKQFAPAREHISVTFCHISHSISFGIILFISAFSHAI